MATLGEIDDLRRKIIQLKYDVRVSLIDLDRVYLNALPSPNDLKCFQEQLTVVTGKNAELNQVFYEFKEAVTDKVKK